MEQRILDAAAQIFARKGYKASLISDISDVAGVGKGTIYQYFSSKQDLFYAVFEWLVNQSSLETAQAIREFKGGTAATRLKQITSLVISSWLEMLDFYTLVFEFWSAAASSARSDEFKTIFRDSYRRFREIVSAELRNGIRDGLFSEKVDTEAIAAAVVGTWDALLLQRWFDSTFDPLTVGDHFIDILLKGLESNAYER